MWHFLINTLSKSDQNPWFTHYARKQAPWGLVYERGGDACQKFWIEQLKESDLGMVQAILTPKRDHVRKKTNTCTYF